MSAASGQDGLSTWNVQKQAAKLPRCSEGRHINTAAADTEDKTIQILYWTESGLLMAHCEETPLQVFIAMSTKVSKVKVPTVYSKIQTVPFKWHTSVLVMLQLH